MFKSVIGIKIINARPAENSEWDTIWQECDYATYFHSREWAKIWSIYSDGIITSNPLLITFSDGKEAVLPFSRSLTCKGVKEIVLTSPGGTYGGWISKDNLNTEHVRLLVEKILTITKNLSWRLNPFDKQISSIDLSNTNIIEDETHVLELSNGFDAVFNNWSKGHKSATTKSRREGVIIQQAWTIEDWRKYYNVYEDSLKRWGVNATSKYSWKLFEEMSKLNSNNIRLLLAVFQGEVIAGALCLYSKRHVVYWHGAALDAYFNLRPVNLLMHKAIMDACNSKYNWFDFNPSGGHDGVKSFKRSFGALSMRSDVVTQYSWQTKIINATALVWRLVRRK